MNAPLEKKTFAIETEFALSEDQRHRVGRMIMEHGYADHQGSYVDQVTGKTHQLAKIHFTSAAGAAVSGSATEIDGLDEHKFDETVHVILEDSEGARTGMKNARGAIPASWHFGVLFEVDGQVWFCGSDQPSGDGQTKADAPVLKRVGAEYTDLPGGDPLTLAENLPAEGELWISNEEEPHVISIPWWGEYAGDPQPEDIPGRVESRAAEAVELAGMVARVRALEASAEPSL